MDTDVKVSKPKKVKRDNENVKFSKDMKHESDIKDSKSVLRKPFGCSLCDSKFSLSFSLKKHIEKSHSTKKKTKTSLKTTEIRSSPNLSQISKNRYETFAYKGSFDCRICHTKFERNGALTMHIKTVHEGKKSWYCSKCKQLRYSERPELSQRQHAKIVIMKKHSQNTISALGGVKRKILFFFVPETMLFYHKKLEYSTIFLQFYRPQTNKKEQVCTSKVVENVFLFTD